MDLTTKQGWVDFLHAAEKLGEETLIFAKNHLNAHAIEVERDEVVAAFNKAHAVAEVLEAEVPSTPVATGPGLPGGPGGQGGPDSGSGPESNGTTS